MACDPELAGAMHTRDGLWFDRLVDGSVGVTKVNQNEVIEWQVVLAANEWASVVAHVAPGGDNALNFGVALRFHCEGADV